MLKLSRKTEYCILALRHLSRQEDRSATVKDLAAALKLSRPLLAKLLQELERKRIVVSSQGASGGFVLHKDLNRLSLMELVEIIDGPVGLTACRRGGRVCSRAPGCGLKKSLAPLETRMRLLLKTVNVADL